MWGYVEENINHIYFIYITSGLTISDWVTNVKRMFSDVKGEEVGHKGKSDFNIQY